MVLRVCLPHRAPEAKDEGSVRIFQGNFEGACENLVATLEQRFFPFITSMQDDMVSDKFDSYKTAQKFHELKNSIILWSNKLKTEKSLLIDQIETGKVYVD